MNGNDITKRSASDLAREPESPVVEAAVVEWWHKEPRPNSPFAISNLVAEIGEPMSYVEWASMSQAERMKAKIEQPTRDPLPGTV